MLSPSRAFVFCFIVPLFVLSPNPAAGQDPQFESPNYALNPNMADKLAVMEETLAVNLYKLRYSKKRTEPDNSCLRLVGKYIDEFEEDDEALANITGEEASAVVKTNPILIFKMIRRIYVTLITETVPVCEQQNSKNDVKCVTQIIKEAFTKANVPSLTDNDWQDAQLGILRIQYIYGFNATSQLRLGVLNGIATKSYLNFHDCLALAKKAMHMEAEAIAYQWLKSSELCLQEGKYSSHSSLEELKLDLGEAWLKLTNLANAGTMNDLHLKLGNLRQERIQSFHDFQSYATCRGENILSPLVQARLHCFHWKSHPYFYINPVKTEILSESPWVLQFFDFIGNSTMTYANNHQTFIKSEHVETQYPIYSLTVLQKLMGRIETLTDLEVLKTTASDLKVTLYGALGGYSDFHHDDSLELSPESITQRGERLVTFLMFTSKETIVGGYITFSELGISVNPIRGSAIFWHNMRKDGTLVTEMIPNYCPVIMGNGEVMSLAIYQYENMFKFPCIKV